MAFWACFCLFLECSKKHLCGLFYHLCAFFAHLLLRVLYFDTYYLILCLEYYAYKTGAIFNMVSSPSRSRALINAVQKKFSSNKIAEVRLAIRNFSLKKVFSNRTAEFQLAIRSYNLKKVFSNRIKKFLYSNYKN